MLIIAYARDARFLARVPFRLELDPRLVEMDHLLDDRKLVLRVTHDLLLSAPQAAWNGRPSTPVEVTLRCDVVRHLMDWSYQTLHDQLVGNAQWRWFCRIYDHPVPNHSTLCDREHLVRPASLHALNNRVVRMGEERKVTRGRKLRTDGTVIETVLGQVDQVESRLRRHKSKRALALADLLVQYVPLVRPVIAQTTRRVFENQTVPASDKIVSLFEPHTAIIQRGKAAPHETEVGRKLWVSEVDGGLVSEYRLLRGNPPDEQQWNASIKNHLKLFHHPPELATADRGVFSPENERAAREAGIEFVALPQPGAKSDERQAYEAQPWFRAALRFRAGIEGRISGLKRARHLNRCPNRGEIGVERWVGWGVITNNLVVIAKRLARRHRSKKHGSSTC